VIIVPEDVMELLVAHADQTDARVEISFDRVLLAVLGEKVRQHLFTETIQVLSQVGEHALIYTLHLQTAARQRANDLPRAEMQRAEIERRLTEHDRDTESAIPWEEARGRLHQRFG
jgi:putative addiction module component (TIGR02574 family)